MKKIWKKLLALALCLVLLGSLAGCDLLDEMRQNQAFAKGYGEILWNGRIYKALPENEYFYPPITGQRSLCLTEEDVPVLLSDIIPLAYLGVSEDEVLLRHYGIESTFCREDQFDAYAARMVQPFVAEELCFQYGHYDYEKEEYIEGFHTLTQEQASAIDQVLKEVEPWSLDDYKYGLSGWSVTVQESSKDHMMRRNYVQITVEGLSAYLLVETFQDTQVYTVPDALRPVFIELINLYDHAW